jgi:hypothetical protein
MNNLIHSTSIEWFFPFPYGAAAIVYSTDTAE